MDFVAAQRPKGKSLLSPAEEESIRSALAKAMTALIEKVGTQQKVADLIGYTQPQVSKVLNKKQLPMVDVLIVMSKELGVGLDQMLGLSRSDQRVREIAREEALRVLRMPEPAASSPEPDDDSSTAARMRALNAEKEKERLADLQEHRAAKEEAAESASGAKTHVEPAPAPKKKTVHR